MNLPTKLRLVILTEIIAPYRIPVFNVLAQLNGIHLHVIFLSRTDHPMREWLVYENEIQFSYQVLRSYRGHWRKHALLLNRGLAAALRKAAPEAIVCGGYNYVASWQALFWAQRNRIPFFLWTESNGRDLRGNKWLTELLKTRFLGRCDGFVVPGQSSREYLKNFGIPSKKIFTAPNAVDSALFETITERVQATAAKWRQQMGLPLRFFLFVGRMVAEKGVFDLLSAYGTLSPELRAEVGLVFVGDGPDRAQVERRANEIASCPRRSCAIQFPGFVQRDALASYYALAEAFVFPTHSDPWGLVVNEAMACGLPIICSDVAGCANDLVENGWNGYVVPSRNVNQLARTMAELAAIPETGRIMGKRSRERLLRNSPQACAEGIAAAVLSLQNEI